jgi:hypothetical protein
MPGGAAGQLMALEDDHALPAHQRQVIGNAASAYAATDNDNRACVGRSAMIFLLERLFLDKGQSLCEAPCGPDFGIFSEYQRWESLTPSSNLCVSVVRFFFTKRRFDCEAIGARLLTEPL